jgi:DNA-binding transcriptional regulator YiaG
MKAIERLKDAGLKRVEIARALNCTRHAVRRWELGETTPNAKSRMSLDALAKQHGILLLASDFDAEAQPASNDSEAGS